MTTHLRVALCQVESHPAVSASHIDFLEEPFIPSRGGPSLSLLGMKGVDIAELQGTCRGEYLAWASARTAAILNHLAAFDPHPHLIVFPEASVPPDLLPDLASYSAIHRTVILAGTHTPRTSPAGRKAYIDAGVRDQDLERIRAANSRNVLPIIRNGQTSLWHKTLLSPLDRSIVAGPAAGSPLRPFTLELDGMLISVLPLICSEALQLPEIHGTYDVVVILAYDEHHAQFNNFAEDQRRNKRLVCICNDGTFGGTRLHVAYDRRIENWLLDTLPNGLPPGDAILVVDLDTTVKAVEVDTAIPGEVLTLVALRSVVPESSPSARGSSRLDEIRRLLDSSDRATELGRLIEDTSQTNLQRIRERTLAEQERRGFPCAAFWGAIGQDLVVANQSGLVELERRLSTRCISGLTTAIGQGVAPESARELVEYLRQLQRRGGRPPALESGVSSQAIVTHDTAAVLDRDEEIRHLLEFLDERSMDMLEVIGLPQIGKSAFLRKAFAQSGRREPLRLPLRETSSVDYLLYAVLQHAGAAPRPPYSDPNTVMESVTFKEVLRNARTLLVERTDALLDHGAWRDSSLRDVFLGLVRHAIEANCKVILETRRELPPIIDDPSRRKLLHVRGFDKRLRQYGVALFNAQLRRVGLSPKDIAEQDKESAVARLGGHPILIALAADVAYSEGYEQLKAIITQPPLFLLDYVRSLVRRLDLADDHNQILRLLAQARCPLPRSVVLGSLPFPAAPSLRDLVALCAVEVERDGRIQIAGVLADFFRHQDMVPETRQRFHELAARTLAQLANETQENLELAVDASYHAGLAGVEVKLPVTLLDGAVATAQSLFERQDYDRAARILETIIATKRRRDAIRLLAQVEARRNRLDRARVLAQEALEQNPRDVALLIDLARTALTQFQDEFIANDLLELAERTRVAQADVLVMKGRVLLRQGRLDDAEVAFDKAKQASERNAWPFYYLGELYLRKGRLEEAADALAEGEEFYFNSNCTGGALHAIRTKLAYVYVVSNEMELAKPMVESLVEQSPDRPEVVRLYALYSIKKDGVKEAAKALERLRKAPIRNREDRCQFHLLYGLFFLGVGEVDRAAEEFSKAHAADRNNVFVMMRWARTLLETAVSRWLDGDPTYRVYAEDCARLTRKILEFDADNAEGVDIMLSLHDRLGIDL